MLPIKAVVQPSSLVRHAATDASSCRNDTVPSSAHSRLLFFEATLCARQVEQTMRWNAILIVHEHRGGSQWPASSHPETPFNQQTHKTETGLLTEGKGNTVN